MSLPGHQGPFTFEISVKEGVVKAPQDFDCLWVTCGPPPLDNVPQDSLKNLFQIRQRVGNSSKGVNVFDGTCHGLLLDPLVFYIISQMVIFLSVW